MNEVQRWPYDFLASQDFPPSDQRGKVSGRLLVKDRYVTLPLFFPRTRVYIFNTFDWLDSLW